MITVYGDLFFLANCMVDAILLISLGVVTRRRLMPLRLAAASVTAGLYSLVLVLSGPAWLSSPLAVLAFPVLPLWIAFRPVGVSSLLRLVGWFYTLALVTAGLAYGLNLWRLPPLQGLAGVPLPVPWWAVGLGLAAVGAGAYGLWRYHEGRRWALRTVVKAAVSVDGRSRRFRALVDTGHDLRDPLTDRPVVVATVEAVAPLLPPALRSAGLAGRERDIRQVFASLSDSPFARRLRVVPYMSVGRSDGALVGFVADTLTLDVEGESADYRRVLIGLTGSLRAAGRYEALLPPELADVPGAGTGPPAPLTDTSPNSSLGRS